MRSKPHRSRALSRENASGLPLSVNLRCTTNYAGTALRYGHAAGDGKAPGKTLLCRATPPFIGSGLAGVLPVLATTPSAVTRNRLRRRSHGPFAISKVFCRTLTPPESGRSDEGFQARSI